MGEDLLVGVFSDYVGSFMDNVREILVPYDLYLKAQKWIEENGGFRSVDEFVRFLIEEFISDNTDETYSPEDEEEIKEKLRKLGYL